MAGATGGSFGSDTNWGGRPQIINGQTYSQYSPQWYDAMRQQKIRDASTTGTAIGTGSAAALQALSSGTGVPIPGSAASSSGVGSSNLPPRIGGGTSSAMTGLKGADGYPGLNGTPGSSPSGSSPAPQIAPIDVSGADTAAFNRAKDQVGQTSASALSGLRSSLGGRGLLGSGAEYRGTTNVINQGQQQLGDVSRSNAINDVSVALDTAKANQNAALTGRGQDLTYGATTRGQDINAGETYRGQDITQRGQDIQSQEAASQLALTKSLADAARQQQVMQGLLGALGNSSLTGTAY